MPLPSARTPTDVQSAKPAVENLWIKRDDRVDEAYGGNKARKLQAILAGVPATARTVLTVGAAGSHFVLALTLFARAHRLRVVALYTEQPGSQHAQANMRAAIALGCTPLSSHRPQDLARFAALLARRDVWFLPLGGSNVAGSGAYVDAARELSAQVEAGVLPMPDVVFVPQGSGGTAAGLAVGLASAGLRAEVVGVAVSSPVAALRLSSLRLARKLAKAQSVGIESLRLRTDGAFLGLGYGHEVWGAPEVRALGRSLGFSVDVTYTEKALRAALDHARTHPRQTVLYWHTLSARSGADLLQEHSVEDAPLPEHLQALFVPMR